MRIIFCDSVINHKRVEPDYEAEKKAAENLGFQTSLISFEALEKEDFNQAIRMVEVSDNLVLAVYRGWMLTIKQYTQLYEILLKKNVQLINPPDAYKYCHYLPSSYHKIEHITPKSVWTTDLTQNNILKLATSFNGSPIIVKDYVKSEKNHWEKACFIPNSLNEQQVKEVVDCFLELRGSLLNEGVVFRQFEDLEYLTEHSKSGMPLTKEFRVFFCDHEIVEVFDYWDEGDYGTTKPYLEVFIEIAKTIESRFFTMDIAKKQNGDWIIMELGDDQVAGLPDRANRDNFYKHLKRCLL
ncbi:MAG: ATP-grasp domain-containing protein [Flavobacteriales bacterium]